MMDSWYENSDDDDDCHLDFSKFKTKFSNICEHCGGSVQLENEEVVCTVCHLISRSSADDFNEHTNQMATVKVLTAEQCRNVTYEIEMMNKDCDQIGIRPLPRIIISTAVSIFSDLKKCIDETRNKKRRQYIASCLYISSRIHNLLRSKKEIQLFCGLSDRNITTTISEIYIAINLGTISINGMKDIRTSFTKSICAKMEVPDEYVDNICSDAVYITDVISYNMLLSSNFDGKTLGAVYVALRVNGFDVSIQDICRTSSVNTDTVKNVNSIVFNNMYLFTRFTERCQKIADEITQNKGSCSVSDVIESLKRR